MFIPKKKIREILKPYTAEKYLLIAQGNLRNDFY